MSNYGCCSELVLKAVGTGALIRICIYRSLKVSAAEICTEESRELHNLIAQGHKGWKTALQEQLLSPPVSC